MAIEVIRPLDFRGFVAALTLIVVCLFFPATSPHAEDFLSAGEVAAIAAASGAAWWLSDQTVKYDTMRAPLIKGPLPLETSIQRFLGGQYKPGKRNFLDDHLGSAMTPIAAGTMLTAANLAWPRDDRGKETLQDFFLFFSGLAATKGVTGLAKGIFNRPRPYRTIPPSDVREQHGFSTDRTSFFSGHTSAAFFSAAYLNLRLRCIMRAEQSPGDYDDWRWAPPTVLFSWASLVGLSRIHAYKHYLSDVLVGALAGYLVAELFYSFVENGESLGSDSGGGQSLLTLRIPL